MSHPKQNTVGKKFNLKIEILDSSMVDNIPSEENIEKWISESFQFINNENKPKNNSCIFFIYYFYSVFCYCKF